MQAGFCVLALMGIVAIADIGGMRSLVHHYLSFPTINSAAVEARIATLANKPQPPNVLGGNFRTHPHQIHSARDATSIPTQSARLVIAEVQASNAGEIVSWEGGWPDWIELWNPGDQPFNATGWHLTDTLDDLQKWPLPELILAPNERILVFASGNDFADEEELHTNFRISKSGELLHLVRPDKTTVEQTVSVGIPHASHGLTFGPSPTDPQPLVYPTPLEPNAPFAVGFTDPVKCSHPSGLYESEFAVTLTCTTSDAVIRFTTDGSVPEEGHGEIYRQPITINHTTIIRARAFERNRVASTVLTRSFLNLDALIHQPAHPVGFPQTWNKTAADYEMDRRITQAHQAELKAALAHLPIVSVVAPNASVFGRQGIYSHPANRGREWEVPAVLELLSHQGDPGFQAPCGLQLAGDKSREPACKKHALRLSFRSRYGLSSLKHSIFRTLKVAAPNRGTGPLRVPAVPLLENEDVLIDATHGLQSKTSNKFENVSLGEYGDEETKYLRTIDERGINLVAESTPFPTPRGVVVHSNLSPKASLGGEVWFETSDRVSINDRSGRFGVIAGMTRAQWDAAIRYWESLGYQVNAIPGRTGCSSLILRGTDDSWAASRASVRTRAQYMRDEWVRRTEQEMGRLAPRGRFVHVCVNGLYWGLYNLVERPDEEYLAHRLGGTKRNYIAVHMRNKKLRTDEAGERLWNKIQKLAAAELHDPTHFAALQEHLNLVDLIDYCLIQMYAGGEDWVLKNGNNLRAYRRKFQNAKLKFMHWDADSTFASGWKNDSVYSPLPMTKSGKPGSFVYLFRRLMTSVAFRQMFAARVNKWCGEEGVLGATACQQRYERLLDQVEPALIAEAARWGDTHFDQPDTPRQLWQEQKQYMRQVWFPHRTSVMLQELEQYGLATDSQASQPPTNPQQDERCVGEQR